MSISSEILFSSSALRIYRVRCRPDGHGCGPVEQVTADHVVYPLRGIFVKHHGPAERVVADCCHALFFKAGEPYRVSHPVGGDECLSLEPSGELLAGIPFRARVAPLGAQGIAARKLLSHRLERRVASPLEAEERALDLLCAIAPAPSSAKLVAARAGARHGEMVEAIQIILARSPGRPWTLGELAKSVHSSPFHLARVFRRLTRTSLHQYQQHVRLAAALDEVLDTSRDLTTIALDLGFSSHSHFTASFRAGFGVTPSFLRRSARVASSKILTARERAAS